MRAWAAFFLSPGEAEADAAAGEATGGGRTGGGAAEATGRQGRGVGVSGATTAELGEGTAGVIGGARSDLDSCSPSRAGVPTRLAGSDPFASALSWPLARRGERRGGEEVVMPAAAAERVVGLSSAGTKSSSEEESWRSYHTISTTDYTQRGSHSLEAS